MPLMRKIIGEQALYYVYFSLVYSFRLLPLLLLALSLVFDTEQIYSRKKLVNLAILVGLDHHDKNWQIPSRANCFPSPHGLQSDQIPHVTARVPQDVLNALDQFVKDGKAGSRTEAIRQILTDHLKRRGFM